MTGVAVGLWAVWLIVAVVLGVAELLTGTLALVLVAIGALCAAIAVPWAAGLSSSLPCSPSCPWLGSS